MCAPPAPGWLSSRRRETPLVLASCSSISTLRRVSCVTVSTQGRPTQGVWPDCTGNGPSTTFRITPSSPITSAMSLATLTKVEASSGASPDSRLRSARSGGGWLIPEE